MPAVQTLLDNGADTSARDNSGNPPLHYAAGCGIARVGCTAWAGAGLGKTWKMLAWSGGLCRVCGACSRDTGRQWPATLLPTPIHRSY